MYTPFHERERERENNFNYHLSNLQYICRETKSNSITINIECDE